MCPRDRIFGDDNGGYCVAMLGLRKWGLWRRRQQKKMILRYWQWRRRRQLRKQKIQCVWVSVYDEWTSKTSERLQRRRRRCVYGKPRYQRQQQRRQLRKQVMQRVWVNVFDDGDTGVFTGRGYWQQQRRRHKSKTVQRAQRQWRRRRQRKRDTWRVWGIGNNNRGGGG